jgi:hypothetical protein
VLDLGNLDEPGFRAIAVIEVAQRCLVGSVDRVAELVRELVGEMDFSWSVVGGTGSSSGSERGSLFVVAGERGRGNGNADGKVKNA